MGQKTYRAAAIGHTGAGKYGHGLHVAYKNLENVEFVAVADPDDAGRKKAVEETGAVRDYSDYRDMLAKEDLDIVSVCPRWTVRGSSCPDTSAWPSRTYCPASPHAGCLKWVTAMFPISSRFATWMSSAAIWAHTASSSACSRAICTWESPEY